MKSCILDARTVAIVKELTVEQRQGANGAFESKEILFRIAVDRDYKVTRQENGKTIQEYPTDFWLAKATGPVAQAFADHCTAKKEDGKLVSRHLLLIGNFETYQKSRNVKETVQVNINGALYNVNVDLNVPDTNTIFMVDGIKFLDRPQNAQANNATVATATATPAMPVAPVAQVAQPVAPVAQAPVMQTAPVEAQPVAPVVAPVTPVAQAPVAGAVAQVAQDMSQAMNPPVVDPNFTAVGQTAPF